MVREALSLYPLTSMKPFKKIERVLDRALMTSVHINH